MNKTLIFAAILPVLLLFQGCAAPPRPGVPPVPPPHRRSLPEVRQPPREAPPRQPIQEQVTPRQAAPQPSSPVVCDIRRQAGQLATRGELDAAAQAVERGLRIAPKDAALWSQLADIRLRQGRFAQARSLAAKSNSLAGGNSALLRKNQQIIEQSLRGH
jgi:hypothetical protein